MGLTKKERREKRETKLAEKRTAKRAERNALRGAVSDYLAGASDTVDLPERPKGKKSKLYSAEVPSGEAPTDTPKASTGPLPLQPIGPCRYQIPASARPYMRVPAVLVASERLLAELRTDPALEQIANVASLPGIVGAALAMPDCHWGYGFPVGGVAAIRAEDGVVSPGGIGFDINCGVRLLRTPLRDADLEPRKEKLADALFR